MINLEDNVFDDDNYYDDDDDDDEDEERVAMVYQIKVNLNVLIS